MGKTTYSLLITAVIILGAAIAYTSQTPSTTHKTIAHASSDAIPYWIESPVGYVWIRVPSLPAKSTLKIYAYKKPGYSPNPNQVFDFFEDFEDGRLDGWYFTGDAGWQITTTRWHGTYAAKNQPMGAYKTACMYRTIYVPRLEYLTFWAKVDAYLAGERLYVYIDNTEAESITGNIHTWQEHLEYIPAGTHTIKFCFKTSQYSSTNTYAAFVDLIKAYYPAPATTQATVTDKSGYYEISIENPATVNCTNCVVKIPAQLLHLQSNNDSIYLTTTPPPPDYTVTNLSASYTNTH